MNKPSWFQLPAFGARVGPFCEAGILDDTEAYALDAVGTRLGETDPEVLLGLALALRAQVHGHAGIDLRRAPRLLGEARPPAAAATEGGAGREIEWPADVEGWEARVLASPLVGGPADRVRPFVKQMLADGTSLLLTRRMWREQEQVATRLLAMAADPPHPRLDLRAIDAAIEALFGAEAGGEGAAAVRMAARHSLAVVTGGPGTGKTFSIKRLLAMLLSVERPPGALPLRVELAAPTGKAAVRMGEAMAEDLQALEAPEAVKVLLRSLVPKTVHKLLSLRPDGGSRYGVDNPLPADVVVIDEASMVDLVLMRKLLDAIGRGTRLVLLGDRDQLVSVEAGTVLADIVAGSGEGESAGGVSDRVQRFTVSRRFADAPTVARVAACIQDGRGPSLDRAVRLLTGEERDPAETMADRVTWRPLPEGEGPGKELLDSLAAPYLAGGYAGRLAELLLHGTHRTTLSRLFTEAVRIELVKALDAYRILAVHRQGPLGVSGLESAVGARIRAHLTTAAGGSLPSAQSHWLGQPVLVTENAYDVDLRNGDVGLCLPDDNGQLAAWFLVKSAGVDGLRRVDLARLPAHSGALAMTVHKSQGSQFLRVAVVLAGRESPIETRELIYTGITRTRSRLDWVGSRAELERTLRREVARLSGLRELLTAQK